MSILRRTKVPVPKHRPWATSTPWEVYFPKGGHGPAKRRFFQTEADALAAIQDWSKGDTSTSLGKRTVDEVHYVRSLLPKGVTLTDLWRFYAQHHDGLTVATVRAVADAYLLDLKRGGSEKYKEEQSRVIEQAVTSFGPDTLFSALPKGALLKFIKEPDTYWNRYGRKRAVSCLVSKAREMDAIKVNPLEGLKFEDAPKATPHTLSNEAAQKIMEHVLAEKPELVPSFALQLFAGIRTEELCRTEKDGKRPLKWEDITFGKQVVVAVEVSKTRDRRVIAFWPEALTHWLNAVDIKRRGVVCPVSELDDAKYRLLTDLEVDFKQNDFRRTYVSNAYSLHGAAVTDWTGHSLKILKKHYHEHKDRPLAEVYFTLKPQVQPSNIIALSA